MEVYVNQPYLEECIMKIAEIYMIRTDNQDMEHQPIKDIEKLRKAIIQHKPMFVFRIICKELKNEKYVISQRIWDVCGCGGFLLTNYQEELTDYFEIGTDVECYFSKEELFDKIDFYLKHDAL